MPIPWVAFGWFDALCRVWRVAAFLALTLLEVGCDGKHASPFETSSNERTQRVRNMDARDQTKEAAVGSGQGSQDSVSGRQTSSEERVSRMSAMEYVQTVISNVTALTNEAVTSAREQEATPPGSNIVIMIKVTNGASTGQTVTARTALPRRFSYIIQDLGGMQLEYSEATDQFYVRKEEHLAAGETRVHRILLHKQQPAATPNQLP